MFLKFPPLRASMENLACPAPLRNKLIVHGVLRYFRTPVLAIYVIFYLGGFFGLEQGISWAKNETLYVSVSYIIDGDSLMVTKDKQELEIRLWGIDAPEYDQKGSEASRSALSSIILHSMIELEIVDRDKYDRLVAIARKGTININEYMVRSGHAWVHVYYCKAIECNAWYALEHDARSRKIGIWKYKNQVPPWEWKAHKKKL